MKNLIFLVSGNGGNLKFIYHADLKLRLGLKIKAVIADRPCNAIEFAQENFIPTFNIAYSQRDPHALDQALGSHEPAVVVTNIHKILAPSTLATHHEFINLHYSLLPSFKKTIGMQAVTMARELGCPFIGVSSHQVVEAVDEGPIIQQGLFRVNWTASEEYLHEIVFKVGALVLLNSLLTGRGASNGHYVSINNQPCLFSHYFRFDLQQVNTSNIWSLVK